MLKQTKEWQKNNPEKKKASDKKWRKNNPKKWYENTKKWRENNLEYSNKWHREWLKTEVGKANNQRNDVRRRAREKEIINTLTSDEWLDILEEYNYRCAYCGCEFDENTLPTRDHIIPISKGGNNTKENIVPACQSCNSKKNSKTVEEFVCPDIPK